MNKKSIILSANGLKNLLIDKEEDFAFVIGGKEIKMNHIFAEFVSPTVAHVHRSDPTVKKFDLTEHLYDLGLNEYEDKIIKSLNDEKVFSSVFQVSRGERVEIENESEKKKLQYFSILLGNDELFDLLETLDYDNKEASSLEEIIFELQFYQRMNPRFDLEQYHKKVDYLSSRLTTEDSQFLINLPTDLLYCILNNKHFQHDNEDIIFDIINEHFSKQNENCNYSNKYNIYDFYEHLQMKKLSLNKFESLISKLHYSEMTQGLWTQLVELILISKTANIKPTNANTSTFEYDGNPNPNTGGDNNEEWRIIDSRTGVQSVSKRNQSDTFHIQTQLTDEESYQYIRFRCTGPTSGDCVCLALSSLEYFGSIVKNPK